MKKLFSFVIILAGMLAFVACGPITQKENEVPDTLTTDPIEIIFWHAMGQANQAVIDEIIQDFNAIYPNIHVTQASQGDYDALEDKILKGIPAGNVPTIAQTYPDHVALYLQAGAARSLDDYMTSKWGYAQGARDESKTGNFEYEANRTDDFVDTFYREGQVYDTKGTFYSLPFNKSTEVMIYNKTFFEKYDLQVPTTWAEVRTVSEQIKQIVLADPNLPDDNRAFTYDSEENMFITMTRQWGGEYTSSDEENHYRFNNQQAKDAVTFFKNMFDEGLAATPVYYDAQYASDVFKEGKVYITTGSTAGVTYNRPSDGSFQLGIAPIPQKEGKTEKFVIQQGTNVTLFKQADPQVELAGWLFMKFLTSPRETLRWATETSYFPVRKSAYESEAYQSYLYGPIVKKQNGENLLDNSGKPVRGELTLDQQGNPVYDADGVPAYIPYVPSLQAQATIVGYAQSPYYFTDPVFPGSSACRSAMQVLIENVLYGNMSVEDAFALAMADLE